MSQVKDKIVGRPRLMTQARCSYCAGCHYGIVTRLVAEVMEELDVGGRAVGVVGPSCSAGLQWQLNIDWMSAAHGRGAPTATGIKRVHPDAVVFTVQGDGDLGAIGLGNTLHAMLRGEKLTTIFLNNACYGQTGGQMAPTTLIGMNSTTTTDGRQASREGYPIHVAELAAWMRGVVYSARWTVHTPANYRRAKQAVKIALQKQLDGVGFSLVELLCACPTNWALSAVDCLKYIDEKMIAEYPLGEFKNVDKIE
ncbi:MAG: thiamine pyrophosphate-dependent enzyme [Dehalococcoidia bacterium]|nr:thiamine pyrophosphate-dependent enzyme [Dehalococcoidia bacterium]